MRINETARLPVTRPESKGPVAGVTAATAVGSQSPMPSEPGQTLPERVEPSPLVEERRAYVRRNDERRKTQVQVLMDTRVAQRRLARRRALDQAPSSIDVQA
jgi:hypothetical protein